MVRNFREIGKWRNSAAKLALFHVFGQYGGAQISTPEIDRDMYDLSYESLYIGGCNRHGGKFSPSHMTSQSVTSFVTRQK